MILQNAEGIKKQIYFSNPEVEQNNAILEELETFADAINTRFYSYRDLGTSPQSITSLPVKNYWFKRGKL
jgi:hypothetical protein